MIGSSPPVFGRRLAARRALARSSVVDLYVEPTPGNAGKPKPSEIDLALRKFIERCWHQQLPQAGKPICQRSGNRMWLTTMPLATLSTAVPSGSVLYRFQPLVQRPRAAPAVPLAGGRPPVRHEVAASSPTMTEALNPAARLVKRDTCIIVPLRTPGLIFGQ